MKTDKELYRQLRVLSCEKLWNEEAPRFDQSTPKERMERVALIRAIGVVFSAAGSAKQKEDIRLWLRGLLQDPNEKIRRYAMAALPKIGAGPHEETKLLSLLKSTTVEREKKFVSRALDKVGGTATLDAASDLLPQTEQKVKASIARKQSPSVVRLDRVIPKLPGLRIHLRCRKGLEKIAHDEVEDFIAAHGKFRILETGRRFVAIMPVAPFSLGDIYSLRCFGTVGFVLGTVRNADAVESTEMLASIITSPLAQKLLTTFTEGSIRYRLNFEAKGHQRGAVQLLANRAYELCPEILNDPRSAPWSMDIYTFGQGLSVELRPRLAPDPRLYYRKDDVDAASHPPLAACMARLAGRVDDEVVWDPFCGSGLELIECALLGGVQSVYGTDVSPDAIAIAQTNFAAAQIEGLPSKFVCCDFRDAAKTAGLGPKSVTLIITNPPLGRRVRVPEFHRLFKELFAMAATTLKSGGRLVFANPLKIESPNPALRLQYRQVIDLGGFDCRLEVYVKN